jgi:hypothetical protein
MHRLYWPVVTYRTIDRKEHKLSTSLSCKSCAEAKETIRTWANDVQILTARIDVYDGSVFPIRKIRTYHLF